MKKAIILFLLLLTTTLSSEALLKVSPTIIELDGNKARGNYITTSFNVKGSPTETIRFKVYPSYFQIDDEGLMEEMPNATEENSLVDHARFMPNEFTLANGNSQKIRLTIAGLKELPEGENRMVLFLEDVAVKEVVLPNKDNSTQTRLKVKSRIGIPVYLDKGKYIKCASIENLNIQNKGDNKTINMQLLSKGNSKVRYTGVAQIIKNKKLIDEFKLSSKVVRQGADLKVEEILPQDKISEIGEYKLRVVLSYQNEKGQNKKIIKEADFSVDKVNSIKI